ncbi:hypothetical protein [Celerinatantimonas sp. YJH-8]|uniref:hypothetical protein n=1 Tax=Celerinatantimonas sp. YJH-8 TaxID=3228714 RepID=UPI0038C6C424
MTCHHDDLKAIMDKIGPYQGSGQRHICAGCAFLLGAQHRKHGMPFNPGAIESLPESQAKPQRHKNAYEAYKLGFESCD